MPDDTKNEKLGLAGAPTFFLTGGLDGGDCHTAPQLIADMAKMEQLRLLLDRLVERLSKEPDHDDRLAVTRPNIIELLNCLHATLNGSLLCSVSEAEDLTVLYYHPAMTLLNDFIGVLKDLDNAKPHTVFETPKVSRAASLSTAEVARRDALLELVDLVKFKEGFSSRAKAEEWLAQRMKKAIGRDKAPKASQLADMRKTRRKKQKKAS